MSENKIAVDRIVDDIVDNFKEITGYDVADVFNKNSDEPVFNQDVIDKSIDSIKNYVSYNYDVDIIANEDILYALDAKLAQQFNQVVDANDNEDPDFIVNESTWAETEVEFGPIAQKKLEAILDANLFGDLGIEIDDNKLTSNIVTGIFTDRYRVAKKEYSNYSEDEIKAARKELFRIINKFYKMATDKTKLDSNTEESLEEDTDVTESLNEDDSEDSFIDRLWDILYNVSGIQDIEYDANDHTQNVITFGTSGDLDFRLEEIAKAFKDAGVGYEEVLTNGSNVVLIKVDKSAFKESYNPPKDRAKMAIEIADYLSEFMNHSDYLDDKYFDEYDREAMGQTFDALVDYAKAKNTEGLSESATEDMESSTDSNQNADEHYIIYDTLDDENKDNDRLYSKTAAIDFLKELLKIEKESVSKSQIEFLTRHREDEGLNFDLDHLSDAELADWFNEFNYKFYDQNKVEDTDEYVD